MRSEETTTLRNILVFAGHVFAREREGERENKGGLWASYYTHTHTHKYREKERLSKTLVRNIAKKQIMLHSLHFDRQCVQLRMSFFLTVLLLFLLLFRSVDGFLCFFVCLCFTCLIIVYSESQGH